MQYLHSVWLLRAAFRPEQQVCAARSLLRHQGRLVESACDQIRLMQKSLTQMNVQLHHVISDLTGVTGMAVLDAILGGERDPPPPPLRRVHVIVGLATGRRRASASSTRKMTRPHHVVGIGFGRPLYPCSIKKVGWSYGRPKRIIAASRGAGRGGHRKSRSIWFVT